jgi:hypothetical protein
MFGAAITNGSNPTACAGGIFMLAVTNNERAFAVALGLDELEAPAGWVNRDERDRVVIVLA